MFAMATLETNHFQAITLEHLDVFSKKSVD